MKDCRAEITTCKTRSHRVCVGALAGLLLLAACSTPATGGGLTLPSQTDTSGKVLPGFDGFAFDAPALDVQTVETPDADDDLASDATPSMGDDTAADAAADVTAGDGGNLGCEIPCAMDDDCNSTANPCTASICHFGCCQFSPTVGVPCDDGVPCNGPDACKNGVCTPAIPGACDDGLTCTLDTCDGEKCHHAVMDGWCHIGTNCVPDQASIPGVPCKICDSKQDQDAWSSQQNCCTKDGDCKALGACDKPSCETTLGQCLIVKIAGCCKSDADCDDGNFCTTDSCDLASGNCASNAVVCAAPSACQVASCDPTDGQCKPDVMPGWCFVDGECVGSNTTNPNNGCQLCLPDSQPTAWSASPGAFCNDKNPCTFSDICTAAGECKGTGQPGCCQSDADCGDNGVACKVGLCNAAVGLCTLADKPGCCTAGICCDTSAQQVLASGTACSTANIGTDYQCNGADIQKRDFTPGCNGTSATVCSKSMDSASASPWATIDTCPANTLCTPEGSGLVPICVVQGSCAGACGGTGSQGCSCTAGCAPGVDCCPDFQAMCACSSGDCCDKSAGYVSKGATCQPDAAKQFQCNGNTLETRSASGQCIGGSACATDPANLIWGGWQTVETCVNSCTAAADGSSGSCVAPAGTCNGVCGGWWTDQPCHCDSSCVAAGNCCADYLKVGCDTVTTCFADPVHSCYSPDNGFMCGAVVANGCSCEITACKASGNCCPDAGFCCYF